MSANTKVVLSEVIEYLESYDMLPSTKNIKKVISEWISNLYSHIGAEAHKHQRELDVIDKTGMSWEEQDMQMLKQIQDYKEALVELDRINS